MAITTRMKKTFNPIPILLTVLSVDMAAYSAETSVPLDITYAITTTKRKPPITNNVFFSPFGFEKRFIKVNTKLANMAIPNKM